MSSPPSTSPVRVTMIRCSTLLIERGEQRFLTDPWFRMHMRGLPVFRRPGRRAEDLPPLDAILASHLHPDHWDDAAVARLVAPPRRVLLPPDGLRHLGRSTPGWDELAPWTSTQIDDVTAWAVPGPHTFPPPDEVNFILDFPGWGRLFFGGDACFDPRILREIGRRFRPIRVALIPVGGTLIFGHRTTMGPEEARDVALVLDADVVVPIHEGGIWMSVPPLSLHPGRARHLLKAFRRRGEPERVCVLREGESVEVPASGPLLRVSA